MVAGDDGVGGGAGGVVGSVYSFQTVNCVKLRI